MMRVGGVGAEGGIGSGGEVFCLMQFLASIDHGGRHGSLCQWSCKNDVRGLCLVRWWEGG